MLLFRSVCIGNYRVIGSFQSIVSGISGYLVRRLWDLAFLLALVTAMWAMLKSVYEASRRLVPTSPELICKILLPAWYHNIILCFI